MSQRLFCAVLLLAVGCNSYTGDMRTLQGIWKIKESFGEEEDRKNEGFETELTIDGHLIVAEGERAVWRFELDESVAPRQIDLEVLQGEEKGQVHRGIYKLGNEHWILCIQKQKDRPRPADFEKGSPGSGIFLILLKRVE